MAVFFRLYATRAPDQRAGSGGDTLGYAGFLCVRFANLAICLPTPVILANSAVSSTKPHYNAPSLRGALTCDLFASDVGGGHATVPPNLVGDIQRASDAIRTISRLLHNSLCEGLCPAPSWSVCRRVLGGRVDRAVPSRNCRADARPCLVRRKPRAEAGGGP